MKIKTTDGYSVDSSIIKSVNHSLKEKVLPTLENYLITEDRFGWFEKDTIEIDFIFTELWLETILIQIKTDSLEFYTHPIRKNTFSDAKASILAQVILLDFNSNSFFNYPSLAKHREYKNNLHIKYHLPDGKEILFWYLVYYINNSIPEVTLFEITYLENPTVSQVNDVKRKFINADFIHHSEGFYQFEEKFINYIASYAKNINLVGN